MTDEEAATGSRMEVNLLAGIKWRSALELSRILRMRGLFGLKRPPIGLCYWLKRHVISGPQLLKKSLLEGLYCLAVAGLGSYSIPVPLSVPALLPLSLEATTLFLFCFFP